MDLATLANESADGSLAAFCALHFRRSTQTHCLNIFTSFLLHGEGIQILLQKHIMGAALQAQARGKRK